ncbi:hypothetical protein JOC34_000382 [Virgibacillus halotolerans]|uniref:hypothetical protein n=1 Tax=Virgibacillus halotolerans TaxID=1071053 RepID=UPI00195F5F1E|nr:hypothetical protein [Virgibacillus halotolerans]MBM7598025.1 hypothetical protein [Virgibacillus halotolerans]
MKCIIKRNTYAKGSFSKSEFWTERKDGKFNPLLPIENGHRTKLTISDAGYQIINAAGEVVSRGLETEVFAIVKLAKSRRITLEPLQIEINTTTETIEMSFDEYNDLYGGADLGRINKRTFKAYQIKGDDYTAIGVLEHSGKDTKSIASLYFEEKLNNREAFETLGEYVNEQIGSNDYGIVMLTDFRMNKWNYEKYEGVIRFHLSKYTSKMEGVWQLAEQAEERRSSITEVFDEGEAEYIA